MKKIFLLLSMATFWVAMQATNIVSLQSVTTSPTEELQIDVSLANSDALTAVEVKIPLDENMTYVDESALLNTARSNGHIISAAEVDQELRIYIYSLSLKTFKGSEGVLFSFKLKLNEDPAIYTLTPEVVLSNKSGKSVAAKVEAGTITILSPKLEFVTREVNFGHVPIRSNYSRTITLKNVGTSKMNVKSVTIPDSRFVVSETQFAIGVGETKSITLKYSPLEHGPITRQLTVVSDAINKEHAIDVVADPYSINELHVGKVEGVADSIVSLPLTVKNMEPIVGVQFRFKMPNKLQFDDFELSPRTNNYIVLNSQEKDTLSMMLYSLSKTPMVGNDGEIGNLKLKLVGNSGYNYLRPLDVVLSNADEENMVSSTSQGWVRIKSPKLNCETSFTLPSASVTSYASGTYVIQNSGQSPLIIEDITFMSEGFKVVGNLPITILAGGKDSVKIEHRATIEDEYSTIMNIYTNDPDNQVKKVRVNSYMFEPNSLKLTGEPAFIKQGEDSVQGYHLNVAMNNYSEIVAMQFDVHWQANMTTDIENLLTTVRLNGHNCSVTKVNSSTYRVLVFSMSNKSIKNKSGNVVTLGYVGNDFKGTIVVDNIILSDVRGRNRNSESTTSLPVRVNKLTIKSSDDSMGKVFGGGYFNRGSKVTISAEAEFGYVFSRWSDGSTDTTRTITLNSNVNLTAIFLTNIHTVELSGEHGTVKGEGEYQHGKEVEIEAIPDYGYHFVRWSDGDTVAKRKFKILDNVKLTAEFAINVYKVELKSVNGVTKGAGEYNHGSTATINAVAAVGYHFVKWSDGVTKAKRSIVVLSDTTLTAEFEINKYTVSVTAKNGKVEGTGEYDYGSIADLVAIPDEGYHFVGWSDGETEAERSIAVMSSVSLTAEFAINVYEVVLNTENGIVKGAGKYEHGDTVDISSVPNVGYHFVKWSDGDKNAERKIVVKSDLNLTAETAINVYTVFLSASNGVVTGTGKYEHGDTVVISVTPNEGYHFIKWSDGDVSMERRFIIVSNLSLKAEIAINVYKLNLLVENGIVVGAGEYNHGRNVYVRAYPDYGYHFVRWSDGVEEDSRYVRLISDSTITAEMAINVYDVELSTENGVVVGAGKYEHGDTITVSAIPNDGYHFVRWSDGNRNAEREIVVTSNLNLTAEIAINVYNVTLTAENGEVTGAGKYNHGEIANISVTPNEGYHFVRWSDDVIEASRSFKVVSDVSLTAKCAINRHSITLSAENGQVKGAGEYDYGTKVTLTAVPNEGYHFVRWSDGDTNIVRDVTLVDDLILSAEFAINTYNVVLTAENGVVSGAGEYEHGTEITIEVTPNAHYHFVRWSDDNTESSRKIKVTSDLTLHALCAIDEFEVTGDVTNGKILGVGKYDYGTTIELTAVANDGYHFVRWSDGVTDATRILTVVENVSMVAEFAVNVYEVILSYTGEGDVIGAGEYEYGKAAKVIATPKEGYHFVCWSDGSTEANRNIVIVEDLSLTAEFAINVYSVIVSAENAVVNGAGKYNHGEIAEISVIPNVGYHFVGWLDGDMNATRSILVNSDTNLVARIDVNVYSVVLNAENGVVTGAGEYDYGTKVTLTAQPNEGYHFVRWSDGNDNATRDITITDNLTLSAEFAINTYNVVLTAENGVVSGAGEYEHGTEITIEVTPNAHYHFVRWSDDNTESSRKIKVTSDLTLHALCSIDEFEVVGEAINGDILGIGKYGYGTTIELSAIAHEGYHFVRWSDGVTDATRTLTVVENVSISAEFAINVYNVTLSAENGAVTGAGEYNHGDIAQIVATPNEGYHFVAWSDGDINPIRDISVVSDSILFAEFAINVYTVSLKAENGEVVGAGSYEHGTDVNISVTPNEGYHFVSWSDGDVNTMRSIRVTSDTILVAKIDINVYTVTLSAENGVVVGSGEYAHGSNVAIYVTPNEGYHFVSWSDGDVNAVRTITVKSDISLTAKFAVNVYSVNLIAENGEVVGAGKYEHGAEVDISVTPNEGYHFVRWSDGNTSASRKIVVTSDLTLTAIVSVNVHTVELLAENGTTIGAGSYNYGTNLTITAIPNEGYHFVGWSDGEKAVTRNIFVVSDTTLTAKFAINVYSVELIAKDDKGSVVGAGEYEHGKTVTIKAIPNEGYHFVKWSDGDGNAERTFVIDNNVALTAEFAIEVRTIVVHAENGTILGAGRYEYGSVVTLTAIPDEGYHFVGWSDGDVATSKSITVHSDVTLTAEFAINVYSVTLNTDNGTVTGAGEYNHGDIAQLVATPNEGYHFVGWSDGETSPVRTITVMSDTTLNAEFAINVYTVTLTTEHGEVVGSGTYEHGTEVTISVTPEEGYHFVCWSDGNLNATRSEIITSDISLVAKIEVNVYSVSLTAENGEVIGFGEYEHGSRVTISVTPDEGYHFVSWSDGDMSITRNLVITSDITLSAVISINVYDLVVNAENGIVTNVGKYEHGSVVDISAIPNAGYHFVGWSDGDSVATRTITLTSNVTLSAYFELNVYELVLEAENGVVFGAGRYSHGTEVSIAAFANEGYKFVGWSDGENTEVRKIVLISDSVLTAQFAVNRHTITLLAENGKVYGGGEYDYGTEITIEAEAAENYHFVRWSDGNTSAKRQIVLRSDLTLTAEFAINQYTVSLKAENGEVFGSGVYEYGTEITISAKANEGYYFEGWSDGSTEMVRTFVVTSDIDLTATFAKDNFVVYLQAENGIVQGGGLYDYGTEITISAIAAEGYHFVSWSDGNIESERTIVVTTDITLTAEFAINIYKVNLSGINGMVAGSGEYTHGSVIELKALADKGYYFVRWSDGELTEERQLIVTSDTTLVAEFSKEIRNVVLYGENGEVTGSGPYAYGSVVVISATPHEGYYFVGWSDGETASVRTITIDSDTVLTALFARNYYTVTLRAEHGFVQGSGSYAYGETITITATAEEGYHFAGWSDGDNNITRTLTVTRDTLLIAEFYNEVRSVVINSNPGGEVTGAGTYAYGATVVLTATPNEGYHFVGWSDGETAPVRTITVMSDTTLKAEFAINVYTVTLATEHGEVVGSGTYEHGTEVTISVTPEEGYHFVCWSDGNLNATRSEIITSDISLVAKIEVNVYSVSLTAENGEVIGFGEYEHGSRVTISVTPDEGYHFVSWSDGDMSITRNLVITSDITLSAVISINVYDLVVNAENGIVTNVGKYEHGSVVDISAIPNAGYHFVGWSDGDSVATRTITLTSNVTLSAYFELNVYELVLEAENGVVFGAGRYSHGTEVSIAAFANEGYKFVGWSDGENTEVRKIVLISDSVLTAQFAVNRHTITLLAENGKVYGGGEYDYGTEITIEAEAAENYHFVRWSDGNTSAKRQIVLRSDLTLTAEFAINQYIVSLEAENGEVFGSGVYDYGTEITISAKANEGYHFEGWSDGDMSIIRNLVITSDITLSAVIAINVYDLVVNAENGIVTNVGKYEHGSVVDISAIPNAGYHFVGWSDGDSVATRTITLTSNVTLSAYFELNVYELVLEAENGVVFGAGRYSHGTEVSIAAFANEGYKFVGWSDGETSSVRSIVVVSDTTLFAEFESSQCRVDLFAENGQVLGGGVYEYGTEITLVAIPNEGYEFVEWSDGVISESRTIVVTSDIVLAAKFTIRMMSVVLNAENGTVIGAGEYEYGTMVELNAIPNEGYLFVGWSDGVKEAQRIIKVTDNIELFAIFTANLYTITLSAENGTFVGAGTYEYGTEVTIVAIPNDGYRFVRWSDNEISISRTIIVTENIDLSAEFEKISVDVKVYTKDQILHVEGAENGYYLYDAFGNVIYKGPDNQIFLPHGVYFIKVGWETIKVAL